MELDPGSMTAALGALRSLSLPGHAEERDQVRRTVERKVEGYLKRPETRGAAWLLQARQAIALGQVAEAVEAAQLAADRLPTLGVAWRVLGEAEMAAEAWGRAVRAFKGALEVGVEAGAGTFERLADALDELGALDEAEEAARAAVDKTGDDPHARRRRLVLLAVVLKHRGDLARAAEVLQSAQLLGPEDPLVWHNLGSLTEARGEVRQAVEWYAKALAREPMPGTSWRLGHALLKLDRPNQALEAFSTSAANLARWPWPASTRWWPAYDAGKLYARANLRDKASGWFQDALREARTPEATREIQSWLSFLAGSSETGSELDPGP
jgi:tetratricopeptide (TPR) repeat protein